MIEQSLDPFKPLEHRKTYFVLAPPPPAGGELLNEERREEGRLNREGNMAERKEAVRVQGNERREKEEFGCGGTERRRYHRSSAATL